MCDFYQSWSLVVWQWIWSQVCRHTSSSCVCAMPTTSMMTRRSDLYSPLSSTASRRSSRSRHTHTPFTFIMLKRTLLFTIVLKGRITLVSFITAKYHCFAFSTEKRWRLWDRFLLVVQHVSFPALLETVQWRWGEITLRHAWTSCLALACSHCKCFGIICTSK